MTGFPLRMAWRQSRGAWRHFLAFFACVVLGVGALVSVGTFAANVERALGREAKSLLGGDVELRGARPLPPDAEPALARLQQAGARVTAIRELVAMARDPARSESLLVELKVVDAAYPLYGELATEPAGALASLGAGGGALVQRELLERLGLRVGGRIAVGDAVLTIAGVVAREPDRSASLISLGPRVMIGVRALEATGLMRFGSRVRYRTLVRLPESLAPREAREELARALADPGVRVSSFDEAQPGLRRFFTQLTTYLGLVGLASLLVGGIGVASSVSTFLRRQVVTIAILKALGAGSRTLVATYTMQTLALGLAGSVAGALLGVLIQPILIGFLSGMVPFAIDAGPEPGTVVRGLVMGVLVSLLCALWPLLQVREVRPSLLLRRDVDAGTPGRRPWPAAIPVALGLVALCVWQAGSLKVGGIFLGASVAALGVLAALSWLLVMAARRVPRLPWPAWRQGVSSLRRPGGHPARVIVALGAGVMLLVAVALLERNIGHQIDHEQRKEAPSFFFVDVQADQREAFTRTVLEAGAAPPALIPIVRARLAAIDGAPVTREMVDGNRDDAAQERAFYFTREYVLTYADEPPRGNAITRGRWWTAGEAATRAWISVEEMAARRLGVGVGSRLTFDVQGVPIEAEITSLRKVDWQSMTMNFFVIFSPGALAGAPATYVASARVPAAAEAALQNAVVAALPNVTAVPVRDILERVSAVLGEIGLAVRLIAVFTVATGIVVMAGALAATRYQRLYESVVLRTLGATRGAVARAFAVEYACLGVTAGVGGTLLAVALAWVVVHFMLDAPWTFEPAAMMAGVMLTIVMAVAIGFLATFRLLGQKPLAVLRGE
ncbi:MAG TPA: FtsX-like permease family protein [Candidatus Limnocylindria bacterium]|nr:FtsX-like permease family protein [Candidatus Limnocylindria bacterium]